ncbi:hypothetical protein LOAG_19031 [Loa loa]|uniref:Uncharacterized protein n=1 Tax=Loa loa TaxID=7209 RepID=A0A1I7VPP8_LOALO|nr:hypothetical protein LOAG_19031 [Loa loa]EJD73551.1 hypothetical protein LOAG_19031 [Loa loa]
MAGVQASWFCSPSSFSSEVLPRLAREISQATGCFALRNGSSHYQVVASSFNLPNNCPIKVHGAVVWLSMCADCNPGVVRIRLGGSPDRDEVSQTRMFSVTSTTTRRIWLRMSFLNDFHLHAPDNPIISLSYVTDCGSYRGMMQVAITLYWYRQMAISSPNQRRFPKIQQ